MKRRFLTQLPLRRAPLCTLLLLCVLSLPLSKAKAVTLSITGTTNLSLDSDGDCGELTVSGELVDEEGNPIAYQPIQIQFFTPQKEKKAEVSTLTDTEGNYLYVWEGQNDPNVLITARFATTSSFDGSYKEVDTSLQKSEVKAELIPSNTLYLSGHLPTLTPRLTCYPSGSNKEKPFSGIAQFSIDQGEPHSFTFSDRYQPTIDLNQYATQLSPGNHEVTLTVKGTKWRPATVTKLKFRVIDEIKLATSLTTEFRNLRRVLHLKGKVTDMLGKGIEGISLEIKVKKGGKEVSSRNFTDSLEEGYFNYLYSPNFYPLTGTKGGEFSKHRFTFLRKNEKNQLISNSSEKEQLSQKENRSVEGKESLFGKWDKILANKAIPLHFTVIAKNDSGEEIAHSSIATDYYPYSEEKWLLIGVLITILSIALYLVFSIRKKLSILLSSLTDHAISMCVSLKRLFVKEKKESAEAKTKGSLKGKTLRLNEKLTNHKEENNQIVVKCIDRTIGEVISNDRLSIELYDHANEFENCKVYLLEGNLLALRRDLLEKNLSKRIVFRRKGYMSEDVSIEQLLVKRGTLGQLNNPILIHMTSVSEKIRRRYEALLAEHPNGRHFWGKRPVDEMAREVAAGFVAEDNTTQILQEHETEGELFELRVKIREWLKTTSGDFSAQELLAAITRMVEDTTYSGKEYDERIYSAFEQLIERLQYIMKIALIGIAISLITLGYNQVYIPSAYADEGKQEVKSTDDFSLESSEWNGGSKLAQELRKLGVEVENPETLNWDKLRKDDVLFIVYPRQQIEKEAFSNFILDGGHAVIADDYGESQSMLEALSLHRETPNTLPHHTYFEEDRSLPLFKPQGYHPLLSKIRYVIANHPAVLHNEGGPILSYDNGGGLIYDMSYGKGRVVVVSDSSLWINEMIDRADNKELLNNVVRYLCAKRQPCHLVYLNKQFSQEGGYVDERSIRYFPERMNESISDIQKYIDPGIFLSWLSLVLLSGALLYFLTFTPMRKGLPLSRYVRRFVDKAKPPQSEFDWNIKRYGIDKETERYDIPTQLLKASFKKRLLKGINSELFEKQPRASLTQEEVIKRYRLSTEKGASYDDIEYRCKTLSYLLSTLDLFSHTTTKVVAEPPILEKETKETKNVSPTFEDVNKDLFLNLYSMVQIVLAPFHNDT